MLVTNIGYTVAEAEAKPQRKQLYDFTFPELLSTKEAVADSVGLLWTGQDRRNDLKDASYQVALWKAWQQSFKTHNPVPQKAMEYFQETKHLSRPPKDGDVAFHTKEPLVQRPRFTWSHSALADFNSCPRYFQQQRVLQLYPRTETDATRWGTEVHLAFEEYLRDGKDSKILDMQFANATYRQLADTIRRSAEGGELLVEHKMAITESFKPCAFDSPEAFGRGIIDVAIFKDGKASVLDYKTGKVKEDPQQLEIFCLFSALSDPSLHTFDAKFIWLKFGQVTGLPKPLQRAELQDPLARLIGKIQRLREAYESDVWVARPSGLCGWRPCQAECPYGRRR